MLSLRENGIIFSEICLDDHLYLIEEYSDSVYPVSAKVCTVKNLSRISFEDDLKITCALQVNIVYNGIYGTYGTYMDYLILDYTAYLTSKNAVNKIKQAWKKYKFRKYCVSIIESSYINWKFKKDVLWNPRTIVGICNLYIEYLNFFK